MILLNIVLTEEKLQRDLAEKIIRILLLSWLREHFLNKAISCGRLKVGNINCERILN